MPYPLRLTVEPQIDNRNRLTTAFRPILVIPHQILVGPIWFYRSGGAGLLGAVAYFLAVVSWFTLLFAGQQIRSIRDFSLYYLRWKARAVAYMALFADRYPPFGDDVYPTSIDVPEPKQPRDRVSIALRLLLVIPHAIVLFFLLLGWFVTTVIAWFAILFTGSYPSSMLHYGLGVMRWVLRVEAYMLLLLDDYPPFSLEEAEGAETI